MKPATLHQRACNLLGVDPAKIPLVGPTLYRSANGYGVTNHLGMANTGQAKSVGAMIYVRRGRGIDTYIHELLHHLFPSRTHKWVYLAAWKLANIRQTGAWYGFGHGQLVTTHEGRPDEERGTKWVPVKIESRDKLIDLARKAAERRGYA